MKTNAITVNEEPRKVGGITLDEELRKYELTDITMEYMGRTLHRIRALKDFGGVEAGTLGGWIESENNLSQEGDAWIADNAKVFDNAKVSDAALVADEALIYDDAEVCGNAWISCTSRVFDGARVLDNAHVFDSAQVFNTAKVFGSAKIYNRARVFGNAKVFDNACVRDNASVFQNAQVSDNAVITGIASIYGNAWVYGNAKVIEEARVYGEAQISGNAKVYNDTAGRHEIREHKSETILKAMAEKISQSIMIRNYVNGNSNDTRRKTSSVEQEIIYKIAFGALLGLNYGEKVRSNRDMEQAIVDTVEFIIGEFIGDCNGYDTIYIPLKKVLESWETE